MMRLYVDDRLCDLAADVAIPVGFDAADMSDAAAGRSGLSLTVKLPSTPANDAVFGRALDPYAAERFNARHHAARIEAGTAVLFSGTAYLLSASFGTPSGVAVYEVRITGGAAQWAEHAARTTIGDSNIEFSMRLTPDEIAATWRGDDRAVRFLPVCRDTRFLGLSPSLLPVERVMMTDDYHPFISVAALVRSIFDDAGYRLRSDFFDGDYAKSLYASGSYASVDTLRQRERADFLARRSAKVSADADFFGRVFASPSVAKHSVGNIVDTADPQAPDENGDAMSDTFAVGECFFVDDDGYACFSPPITANVGFLLHLEYETSFRILSRRRLKGFDRIALIGGLNVEFTLANSYADHRSAPVAGNRYRAIVFDHEAGRTYSLRRGLFEIAVFSSRSASATIPAGATAGECSLLYRDSATASWKPYEGDWALYSGYVEECGTLAVQTDIRIPPSEIAARSKLLFDKIVFSGAEEGMTLTLGRGCSLRPYFSECAGYGSTLTFADIAARRISRLDFLAAVCHLFNLVVRTDNRTKTVRIEPMEQFYDGSEAFDWSDRIDRSQPMVLSDIGIDAPQYRVFGYLEGDAATAELDASSDAPLGVWRSENPLYGTKQTTRQMRNPLFTTTVNTDSVVATAPSASVMRVGGSDDGDPQQSASSMLRIVRYLGMHPLPSHETWGYPHDDAGYPLAAFVFGGDEHCEGFTLGFEDRDGHTGLHRYYDGMLDRERMRQYLTVSLRLAPEDIARLSAPDGCSPWIGSTFLFTVNGECSRYRLWSIGAYDPSKPSTECRFIRLMEDRR